MPKNVTKSALIREWINKIGEKDVYTTDGKIIYCQACNRQVKLIKKYTIFK